jgi:hypothetical protein
MKITKRQLKRIIKEEKRRLLAEQPNRLTPEDLDEAVLGIFYVDGSAVLGDVFDALRNEGYSNDEIDAAYRKRAN